jgi:hypothetical protein
VRGEKGDEAMTSRDFCFWLQGFFELNPGGTGMSAAQANLVKRHLALVFKHEIDPSMGDTAHQAKLDETHGPPVKTEPAWARPQDPDGPVARC